ncbi:hypothetical protein B0H16DRAFT_1746841 [Mycena metata]|uniref:Uncharacterized protein n=1 Tax=Mycena metata TaxID=1033252 RepID=A0AAD7GWH9_9AGAR|nr:hypothetical protein B0H16DRAFT_1746841 [Mycena metata]
MSNQATAREVRVQAIKASLGPTLNLLGEINEAFAPPFIQAIAATTRHIINSIQNVKKDEYFQFIESIHQVIYAIITLHLKSETGMFLAPKILEDVRKFTETLHKIYTVLGEEQEGSKIKRFFRQSEINRVLKECRAELDHTVTVFKAEMGQAVLNTVDMRKTAETMHEELLDLISALSDGSLSEQSSLVCMIFA